MGYLETCERRPERSVHRSHRMQLAFEIVQRYVSRLKGKMM